MATWKKVLTEEDGNLATTDLTCTSTTRNFKLASGNSLLNFQSNSGDNIFSMVAVGSVMTTSLSGGMQIVEDAAGTQGCLKLFADDAISSYVCLMANSSATADQKLFFPPALPSSGQVLKVNSVSSSNVNLEWADAAGVTIDDYADTRLLTAGDSSSNIDAEANLTFDGNTLHVAGAVEFTADYNSRAGERYDAGDGNFYATNAKVTAGDVIIVPKAATSSVTEFKVYTLNGSSLLPELLDASGSSGNIEQIAFLCPRTLSNGAQNFYLRCMATIPVSDVNGSYSNSAGDPVYLDTSNTGELTLTEPTSGYVRQMGYIINGVTISSVSYYIIWFDPSPTYIRV